jgi:hypothetical protein
MFTRPLSKFFAVVMGALLSAVWLGTIVTGMHNQAKAPVLHSIELPRVVIVAHKTSAPNTSAQAKPVTAHNG